MFFLVLAHAGGSNTAGPYPNPFPNSAGQSQHLFVVIIDYSIKVANLLFTSGIQMLYCTCMYLWGVAVLELEGHSDHDKVPDPFHRS